MSIEPDYIIKRDQLVYKLAHDWLAAQLQNTLPPRKQCADTPDAAINIIRLHLKPGVSRPIPKCLHELYKQILVSAQNAERRPNVIGGTQQTRLEKIGEHILENFDPYKVLKQYTSSSAVLQTINTKLKLLDIKAPINIIETGRKEGIWSRYCKTIISAAKFVTKFKNI